MQRLFVLCLVSMAILSSGITFAGEINWVKSLDEGLKLAKQEGKPIMADFYTDWCGWCKKLDQDTYSNAKVQGLADKFVCVKVNGDKDTANTKKFGINGYPTIIFLDSAGKEIDRNVGYANAEELSKTMAKIISK